MTVHFFDRFRSVSMARQLPTLIVVAVVVLLATTMSGNLDAYAKKRSSRGGHSVSQESFDLKGFDAIRVDAVAEIEITIGPEFRVELEAREDLIDRVEVFVRKKSLVIDMEDERRIDSDRGIHLDIMMPKLVSVVVKGVAWIEGGVLDNEHLEISCPGVGEMRFQGVVGQLDVDLQGVGDLDFKELIADDVKVTLGGVGDVVVHAGKRLDARVNGMGSIRYHGNPENVRTHVGGLGRIKRIK
ncbi:MAG: DUF2807 domain-containing protein [Candidatus Latescibacterota bacterium]|nr:MAG: DUF2807 domain-containing protein [Candidatus Latescibacterota bacterium]